MDSKKNLKRRRMFPTQDIEKERPDGSLVVSIQSNPGLPSTGTIYTDSGKESGGGMTPRIMQFGSGKSGHVPCR